MLQINSEGVQIMLMQIMERFDRIDRTLERMNKLKECLEGDTLLDNYDLCQLLGITKRTLARYRQKKYVTYYMIDGRTYYKASEVEAFLNTEKSDGCSTQKMTGMEIVCIDKQTFDELRVRFGKLEEKVMGMCRPVEDLGLKKWLDNQEVCEILRISKKTLQVYRDKGILPYSRIKHKIFFKTEDVHKLLESNYYHLKREL